MSKNRRDDRDGRRDHQDKNRNRPPKGKQTHHYNRNDKYKSAPPRKRTSPLTILIVAAILFVILFFINFNS